MSLRKALIKLAQENPSIREHIVPLLRTADNDEVALSAPIDAGTMRGAQKWVDASRLYILDRSEPRTPERKVLIEKAQRAFGYAAFLFRRNRGLVSYYDGEAKRAMADLFETNLD